MVFTDKIKSLFGHPVLAPRRNKRWPFVPGPYYVVDDTAPVIVIIPDDDALVQTLTALSIQELCMICPICRSASDVEKLIRNVEANLAVHCILLAGGESGRDYPALEALRAIFDDDAGISEKARQIAHGARGKLKSFDFTALQKRVSVVNMLDCVDVDKIVAGIIRHGAEGHRPDTGFVQGQDPMLGVQRIIAPTSISHDYQNDKAGKYIIGTDQNAIVVEHYNSKGELLRVVQGASARDLCIMLIRNGWVSRLDHAAYLGRELALAEIAVQQGLPYERKEPVAEEPNDTTPGGK